MPERGAALLSSGSIEFSHGRLEDIASAADMLPRGLPVFVPILPGRTLDSSLATVLELHNAGFEPVPHLAARRIPARAALREFLAAVQPLGATRRLLLIGGDSAETAGPFADAAALLEDGLLRDHGVLEVGFAGYPEGHPQLPLEQSRGALLRKLERAAKLGLGGHVVTQFSFLPNRILEYCSWLASAAPETPVYVGVPGPASLRQLVHFARYCGVAASLSAAGQVGVKVVQLANHMHAPEQLNMLAGWVDSHAHSNCNVTGVHVFSFGGFAATARWVHDCIGAGSQIATATCKIDTI